ncbi:MAG: hypothetical protein MRERV_71c005 [Mycoplasmataceae bacterium RV_VA103A]|nr:MAG: hypothetical protein MRERV_71c005 [Mycoplasmataceae bacterium RV_VA103A]
MEGTTEYILFNNVLREKFEEELNDIEIIPIFGKFHYVFFDELAKKLDLNYWFLLDKDKKIDDEGKENWTNKQKNFWEKYGENETNEETNGITHSKESGENRISWLPSDTEEFLGIKLEHNEKQCCKEYNIISREEDILENLEREQEKIKELKKIFSLVKTKKKNLNNA